MSNPFKTVFPRRKPGGTPTTKPPRGALSIYEPAYLGVDTRGRAVTVPLMYRHFLLGGTPEQQKEFVTLVRDLVARGRAAGIIVVAATQRPSADIVPTSLRDLFSYRLAFRCTTDSSSDIILGTGWAKEGLSAKNISPEA